MTVSVETAEYGKRFDYVIVGGGTAGCVMASRLSEAGANQVLLIEAGVDTPPDSTPEDIRDPYPFSYSNPAYRWRIKGYARQKRNSSAVPLLQAQVMGGGSSIMGMIMIRGAPKDYDDWESGGASGWSWRDVAPVFRRLETDLDFSGELHGKSGPTVIRRHSPEVWPPTAWAARRFAEARGFPYIEDMNADFRDGYCALPIAGDVTERATSAAAYLTRDVRARSNLTIMPGARVVGLVWEGRDCRGVKVEVGGSTLEIISREVVLTMGALLTPVMLLREGVGDSDMLKSRGISVRHHLAGVGRNLQNHTALTFAAHLRSRGLQRNPERNHNNTMFRYSSSSGVEDRSDMALVLGSRLSWHGVAKRIAHLAPIIMAPDSRGRITVEANGDPLIEFNLLSATADERRLMHAIGFIDALRTHLADEGMIGRLVPVVRMGPAAVFAKRTQVNALLASALGRLSGALPPLGDSIVGALGAPGLAWEDIAGDESVRREFVNRFAMPIGHHCGTCRMGRATDADAVVSAEGEVFGVGGLRVADASVMPSIPRANTNLPTLMVAEKLAETMLSQSRK